MAVDFDWKQDYRGNLDWLEKNTILMTLHGSQAYGLATETSDIDIKGVAIPPKEYFTGFLHRFEQAESKEPDLTIFDIRKFFQLAADCNPNIIEILWTDDEDIISINEYGHLLRHFRDHFLSKKAKHTFGGYAIAQLKRIKTHRRWLLNPVETKPVRADFDLPETSLLSADEMGAVEAVERNEGFGASFSENTMLIYQRERSYRNALREWQQYQNWKTNRNPARAEMEAKYGYDCYTDDTEFLTDSGWKNFDSIGEKDLLATVFLSPTGKDLTQRKHLSLEYQAPIERFEGTFTGNLYQIYGNHLDVLVTPNHRALCRKVERKSQEESGWLLEEVANLPDCFDVLIAPEPRLNAYKQINYFNDIPIPPTAYLSLMGWFLSDGCMLFSPNGKLKSCRISQKKYGRLSWHMARFFGQYKETARMSLYEYQREPNNRRKVRITERVLDIREPAIISRLYNDCGRKKEKHIPRWVFGLTKRFMEKLFDGLVNGDGTVRNTGEKSIIYYSSLKGLADNVQELAFRCGWETSLYGPYPRDNDSIMYQVHVNKNTAHYHRLVRSANIKPVAVSNQRIVCFTVPNGTLITRRNGHIGIHGNSKHAMHLVRLMRMCREILTDQGVIVKRPDREELLAIRNGAWTYDQLMEWAERQDAEMNGLAEKSSLRRSPDRQFLSGLCGCCVENFLGLGGARERAVPGEGP